MGKSPPSSTPPDRRVVALVLGLTLCGIVVALAMRRIGDFDLPWHLAFGRFVIETGSIPNNDPLAFTEYPIQYAALIADGLLWITYRLAGPLGLQLLGAFIVGAIAVVLYTRAQLAAGAPNPVAPVVVGLSIAAMNPWLIVRPALLSFLLLALHLYLIDRHRAAPKSPQARRSLALLVPLGLVWANVHGFVVVGVVVSWLYAFYRGACRLAAGRAGDLLPVRDGEDAMNTGAVAAAATVATTLNLAGPGLLLGPLRAVSDFGSVTEWATTDLSFLIDAEPASGALLLVALAALAFGRQADTGRRTLPLYEMGLVVVALVLARSAVRLIPVAAVLIAPLVARRLGALVPSVSRAHVVGAIASMLVVPYLLSRTESGLGVGFDERNYPEVAVGWIESHQPAGRMWNFSPYGGYLSLRLYPTHRVLIDGRTGWVHDPAFTSRTRKSDVDVEELRKLVTELQLEWAVSRAVEGEAFGVALARAPEFTMTHLDNVSAVYVRAAGPNAHLAEAGYRLLRHLITPGEVLRVAVSGDDRAADLAHDGALALSQDPNSPRAAFFAACGYLAIRDRAAFDDAVASLGRLAPGNPAIEMLGQAWSRTNQR